MFEVGLISMSSEIISVTHLRHYGTYTMKRIALRAFLSSSAVQMHTGLHLGEKRVKHML